MPLPTLDGEGASGDKHEKGRAGGRHILPATSQPNECAANSKQRLMEIS
jgi:hypothetical protein